MHLEKELFKCISGQRSMYESQITRNENGARYGYSLVWIWRMEIEKRT